MTNNKIPYIVIAVLVFIVIGGGLFFFSSNKGAQKETRVDQSTTVSSSTTEQTPTVQPSLSCAKEGEQIGASGMPLKCCEGLMESNGGGPGGLGGLKICFNCGDNFCDTNYGEHKGNCPKDCMGKPVCLLDFQDISNPEKEVCCKKLKAIKIALYQDDCSITPNSAPVRIVCMYCGDGRCDQGVYLENKCNCPEDCK